MSVNHRLSQSSRPRTTVGFLFLSLLLLLAISCTQTTEQSPSLNGQTGGSSTPEKKSDKAVDRPDPLFEQYEYPGSTRTAATKLGQTVSATYISQDDFKKVVDFYRQKFGGSKQVSVQETAAYFGTKTADGSGLTATITIASDDRTQIILRLDKNQ